MIIGFDFESETFHAAQEIFKHMEIAEAIYEGAKEPSQTKHAKEYSNQYSGRKKQGR